MAKSKRPLVRRKTAQQKRGLETTTAILKATKILLRNYGPDGVNTNAIANKAGVSIGSLYQYFPNKNAILVECYAEHKNELLDLMKTHIGAAKGESVEIKIERIVFALIKAHQHDPDLHHALSKSVDGIIGKDKNKDVKKALYDYICATLSECRDEIHHPDFMMACHIFYYTVEHLIHFVTRPNSTGFEPKDYLAMIVEQATAFLLHDPR